MKKVKFKGVTWMRPASVLFLLLISVGCSHNGNGTAGDVNTAGQVELCISAGGGAVSTRTAFNEGTPVEILAYARRQDAPGTEAFAGPALIYVAEGMATGLGEEETALSGVTVARVNGKVVADGRLLVEAGYIYDVVVLANTSSQRYERNEFRGVERNVYFGGYSRAGYTCRTCVGCCYGTNWRRP